MSDHDPKKSVLDNMSTTEKRIWQSRLGLIDDPKPPKSLPSQIYTGRKSTRAKVQIRNLLSLCSDAVVGDTYHIVEASSDPLWVDGMHSLVGEKAVCYGEDGMFVLLQNAAGENIAVPPAACAHP